MYDSGKGGVGAGLVTGHQRLLCLDVLRASAIFLVLFNHMYAPPRSMPEIARKGFVLLDHIGWIGVDLFFVLSGFLVSGLIFREHIKTNKFRVANFYIRRGLKIYPSLYFLVLVSIIVQSNVFDDPPATTDILGDLLFLQNYIGAVWGHTWSLAVEEHFYILLPLVLMFLALSFKGTSNPFRLIPAFFIFVAIVELGLRIYTNLSYSYTAGTHMFRSHLRFDSLLFGVLISYFYHYHYQAFFDFVDKWKVRLFLVVSVLVAPILLLPKSHFLTSTIGLTLLFILSGIAVSWLLSVNFPKNRLTTFAGYIGLHSYSIYLWHYAIIHWLMAPMKEAGFSWGAYTATYLTISIVAGILMAKLVEFPVLYLRDRWFPARQRAQRTRSSRVFPLLAKRGSLKKIPARLRMLLAQS